MFHLQFISYLYCYTTNSFFGLSKGLLLLFMPSEIFGHDVPIPEVSLLKKVERVDKIHFRSDDPLNVRFSEAFFSCYFKNLILFL